MAETTILTLVGSLRSGSINQQFAETAAELAPEGTDVQIFRGLEELPFYNEDLDVPGAAPQAAQKLRDAAAAADSLLLVTPEYNGTIPAVLKNAIDWLSRPYGQGAISGKPSAVIGTSLGQYGGVWAHNDTRKALKVAGARVLEDIVLSTPGSITRFAELHPKDEAETREQILSALNAVVQSREEVAA